MNLNEAKNILYTVQSAKEQINTFLSMFAKNSLRFFIRCIT